MKKDKISFFFSRYEVSYFKNLIKEIPKDICRIIILENEESLYNLPIDNEYHAKFWGFHDIFTSGYDIFVANNDIIRNSDFSVTTAAIYYYNNTYYKWIDINLVESLRDIYLVHSTDASGVPPKSSRWMIAQHMRMALTEEKNKHTSNFSSLLKSGNVTEYAYTGIYSLGEWEQKRKLPKNILQKELEQILGRKLKKDQPVIVFFQDEISDWREYVMGLNELSKSANVIYKSYAKNIDRSCTALHDGIYIWPSDRMSQNILRFSADIILAGYHSGTFVSSAMLGLKVIPYHTSFVLDKSNNNYTDYIYFLEKETIHTKIINYLNLPLLHMKNCNKNTLHDIFYHDVCSEKLERLKKNVFFDYMIDGATQKTAQLILKAFNRGTFGDAVVALRQNI